MNSRTSITRGVAPKTITSILLVIVLAAAGLLVARSYLFGEPTIADIVSEHPDVGGGAQEVTLEYCSKEIDCVEAWKTKYGVYARFSSELKAEHWGEIFGPEGARWNKFALDARGMNLTSDQRETAVQILLAYDGI